jgi:hypothetical protein
MTETGRKEIVGVGGEETAFRPGPASVVFERIALGATLMVIALGVLDIIGTILNVTLLTSVAPQWVRMKIITAVCFVLAGFELAFLMKRPALYKHFYSVGQEQSREIG